MMQTVVTPELRGSYGMHYTSVPNIMKVIQPLFLNDLESAFADAFDNAKKLDALLIRISKMKFFDPACGSGNFLIITYKELRRLEIRIWQRITELSGLRIIPFTNISISQFYGIELDGFAHEIGMLSLWLAEHQMNAEFTRIFSHVKIDALPLKNINTLIQGNACRIDWNNVCPHTPEEEVFVFGNPPYLGRSLREKDQQVDMDVVFNGELRIYKDLDYISCWFYKATEYIRNTVSRAAFVPTNSISQGIQVGLLWPSIFNKGVKLFFTHNSFKWLNNAKNNAGVTVCIIGLTANLDDECFIYKEDKKQKVKEISPYLTVGSSIVIQATNRHISNLPLMTLGSAPKDSGNLIMDSYEKELFVENYPDYKYLVKRFVGSDEFINGKYRYCFWINDKDIDFVKKNMDISKRLEKVRVVRLASKKIPTQKLANTPYRFGEARYRPTDSIIIPSVSSERREYIPIGFLDKNIVISNLAFALYDAQIWLFGILTSKMHMAWVKAVGGSLESRIRYSATLCYNTFPFPKITEAKRKEIEYLAEEVLFTRESHTEKTLAQMYDPDKMPADLRAAHHTLDLAVDSCYRDASFTNDEERLQWLFKLYETMIKKEGK